MAVTRPALSGREGHMIRLVHLQVRVEDLEHLLDIWHVTGLQLGPNGNVVQSDLEGPRGQEVSLHHVADEEGHQTREDLVALSPGPNCRGVGTKERERVLAGDDDEDGDELQVGDQVTSEPVEGGGGVVFPLDADVWINPADGLGVFLEDFTVPSGDAVAELENRAGVQGGFGGFPGLRFGIR